MREILAVRHQLEALAQAWPTRSSSRSSPNRSSVRAHVRRASPSATACQRTWKYWWIDAVGRPHDEGPWVPESAYVEVPDE